MKLHAHLRKINPGVSNSVNEVTTVPSGTNLRATDIPARNHYYCNNFFIYCIIIDILRHCEFLASKKALLLSKIQSLHKCMTHFLH